MIKINNGIGIFLLVTLFWVVMGTAQSKPSISAESDSFIPMEQVYVHYNSSLLLTGEYLYYSIFCRDLVTKKLSNLSKIAYVELVDKSGQTVFKHKIKLTQGRGQGDFFISTQVPSGSYKLVGYTKLMVNGKEADFFQGNLVIINPYTNDQRSLRKPRGNSILPVNNKETKIDNLNYIKENKSGKLVDDSTPMGIRKRVIVDHDKLEKLLGTGSFSISIRKLDSIPKPYQLTGDAFVSRYKNTQLTLSPSSIIELPEARGELISGKVVARNEDISVERLRLAISIPGKNYDFAVIDTDINGTFNFIPKDDYEGSRLVIKMLDDIEKDSYDIVMDKPKPLNTSKIHFRSFYLKEKMREVILERSIHNQIENNYFSFKPDSIITKSASIPFYGGVAKNYILDEFTRFATLEETILEIIENVSVRQIGNNKTVIQIRSEYPKSEQSGFVPLVLMDGNLIEDFSELLEYDARKIEKISVVTDTYVVGPQVFQGILDVTSSEGTYSSESVNRGAFSQDLFLPLPKKNYFNQNYEDEKTVIEHTIPDYRHQLLWNPEFKIDNRFQNDLIFSTSDVKGIFEIRIEGFDENGKAVSYVETFVVK